MQNQQMRESTHAHTNTLLLYHYQMALSDFTRYYINRDEIQQSNENQFTIQVEIIVQQKDLLEEK